MRRSRRTLAAAVAPAVTSTRLRHRRVLEPMRREHRVPARRQRERGRALRVEVGHLERAHLAVEAVVGVAPRVVRSPAASVRPRHRKAHGRRRPRRVGHGHGERSLRMQVPARLRNDRLHRAARNRHDAQRHVAALVRDERDAAPVRRPARPRVVALAVGQLEGIPALGRRQPELVALAPEVRAVDDAVPVARPVGVRLPVRLFLAHEAHRRAGLGIHAPEVSGAPHVAAVGDEDQLLAVGRPGRREVLVELRVVVARQAAVLLLRDPLRSAPGGFPSATSTTNTCQCPWKAVDT